MAYKIFSIPIPNNGLEQELNRFLAQNRIIGVKDSIVQSDGKRWCVFIVEYSPAGNQYTESKKEGKSHRQKKDYSIIMEPQQFRFFEYLRKHRKKLAEQFGVPVYAVLNNDQLAYLVSENIMTKTAFLKIEGLGKGKFDKYGESFLEAIKIYHETGRESVSADNGLEQPEAGLLQGKER